MLNRDSSVKSMWPHCSGVQLRCSWAQCNRSLMCTGDKGTQTTGRRANSPPSCSLRTQFGEIWVFLQQQRAATPAVTLLVSPASGTLQQVAIVCRCGDSQASRPTSSTGVLIHLVMVPQHMDDTTMHIQLSGNSRLSCTSLQHTDSPPTRLFVEMISSTHAFHFGHLGFRGTIAACKLKHRSGKPPIKALRCDRGIAFYAHFGCLFAFGDATSTSYAGGDETQGASENKRWTTRKVSCWSTRVRLSSEGKDRRGLTTSSTP
ncbi:hypothetical protein AVEN_33431-1 [Araneus ventricosus]|uniref:Uncharacterized protein n=1 Tax=Araneus ventricosus TaxID=182803 RepID=A0A4Y2ITC2_ARAVE|nr:hypothetical protein AVEN_33431-1 [Araneus ventricosus]